MNIPENIIHHFSDGLYAKETIIKAGEHLLQHKHTFSHLSILAQGKVVVTTEEGSIIVEAPACLEIKANTHHGVKALTDCVWYCVHATDEKDPSKVDEVIIARKQGE
jgi:quercetin dioxygenase-like cupin family protein